LLEHLTDYTYRVFAISDYGSSASSNELMISTLDQPPAAPSDLEAVVVSGNEVFLQWVDNADNETGFRVHRREGTTGPYPYIATLPVDTTTYTDTTVQPDTEYTYYIIAFNDGGYFGNTNYVTVTTTYNLEDLTLDDADPAVTYTGNWTAQTGWSGRISGTIHESNQLGAAAQFAFEGNRVQLIADKQPWGGQADVYIDDVLQSNVSFYSETPDQYQQLIYDTGTLTYGQHTIRLVKTGGDWIYVDAFIYTTQQASSTESPPAEPAFQLTAVETDQSIIRRHVLGTTNRTSILGRWHAAQKRSRHHLSLNSDAEFRFEL